jgi:hypothetical protein
LRILADAGCSIDAIAEWLRRSSSAVRNKAGMHGISVTSVGGIDDCHAMTSLVAQDAAESQKRSA